MKTRSSIYEGRRLGFVLSLLILLVTLGWVPRLEAAKEEERPVGPAQIRVWKGLFASDRQIRVVFSPAARKQAPLEFDNSKTNYFFGEYTPIPAGGGSIDVFDTKEPKTKLATLTCPPTPGSYFTVLLKEAEGNVTLQLLDDSPNSLSSAELAVRNFIPSLVGLEITIGTDVHLKLPSAEAMIHLCGLARSQTVVNCVMTDKQGKQVRWSNEVDFTKMQHADILIYPDSYGRLRSRVVASGEPAEASAEKSAAE